MAARVYFDTDVPPEETSVSAGNPGPVIPARYAQALGQRDPLDAQRESPGRLSSLIAGYDERTLATPPAEGKWSVKQVIAHLADGEVINGSRLRFVAAHDRPPIPGYNQDAFVERLGVDRTTTMALLEAFAMARTVNLGLLARLPPESLQRVGLHAERGEESIQYMLTLYAGHDLVHEEQIQRTLAAVRAGA